MVPARALQGFLGSVPSRTTTGSCASQRKVASRMKIEQEITEKVDDTVLDTVWQVAE